MILCIVPSLVPEYVFYYALYYISRSWSNAAI